jgi:hypothetical protein
MAKKRGIFKETLFTLGRTIKKNQVNFIGLFFLSLILVAIVSFVAVSMTIPVITKSQDLFTSIQENLKTQNNPSGDFTFMAGNENYVSKFNEIKFGLIRLVLIVSLVWAIITGFIFGLFNRMVKKLNLLSYLWKYVVIAFIYLIPAYFLVSWYIREAMGDVLFGNSMKEVANFSSFLLVLLIFYFMFISLFVLPCKFKEIFTKTWFVVKKAWHKILGVYLINVLVLGFFTWLLFVSTADGLHVAYVFTVVGLIFIWVYLINWYILLFVKEIED